MTRRAPTVLVAAAITLTLVAGTAALVSVDRTTPERTATASWAETVAEANGQTVKLWMWGGDAALNAHVDNDVAPRAAQAGVTLQRVPIDDTAVALQRLVAEREAGRDGGGAIDVLWVNGKNFEQGQRAGLWLESWVDELPNSRYLDPDDPTVRFDFGVPTLGQEAPWSRAAFVFAYDRTRVDSPPRNFADLELWVHDNPGRMTYPAPPDFTGSAFVRQAVQALGEDRAFTMLAEIKPNLWRSGESFPRDQPELDRLFAAGEVDVAMSYNPNFVDAAVRSGIFAPDVRPYVFDTGTLQNVSFLAIPANASSAAGAQVVVDLMLSPAMQAAKLADVGVPTVLSLSRVENASDLFSAGRSPLRLDDFGRVLEEVPAGRVPEIDRRWRAEVLR